MLPISEVTRLAKVPASCSAETRGRAPTNRLLSSLLGSRLAPRPRPQVPQLHFRG